MLLVEPLIISLIVQLSRIRAPILCSTGLALANSLIRGTETEAKVIEWKKKYSQMSDEWIDGNNILGRGYWQGFMSRNGQEVESKRGEKFAMD